MDEFCVMFERADRDNGESSEYWADKLESFLSDMAQEIFGSLPEEFKLHADTPPWTEQKEVGWNACRSTFLVNINKLK